MTKPTIHLNGTSGQNLASAYQEAGEAINAAIAKLQDSAPNGRDYYPQGADAIQQASKEHYDRIERIMAIKAEIEELWAHCEEINEQHARNTRRRP